MSADAEAFTLADFLDRQGIPPHEHQRIRNAVHSWLSSWRGATPSGADAEAELSHLITMLGYGR